VPLAVFTVLVFTSLQVVGIRKKILLMAFSADPLSPHICRFAHLHIIELSHCTSMHINFEFKARHHDIAEAERMLASHQARFVGEDHQVDTYFHVPNGRLKLREGTIEQALIFYERSNVAGAKQSDVILYQHKADESLKRILIHSLGIKAVVDKKRRIYFIDNVKFHFDTVEDLGSFVEVEAIDKDGNIGLEKIKEQCFHYQQLLGIASEDLLAASYSDMLLARKSSHL
jgi:predicted adenylyl cyclase CyaB